MESKIEEIRDSGLFDNINNVVKLLIVGNDGKPVTLVKSQEEIVEDILHLKRDRIAVIAYTGYGKTWAVSIGGLLCAIFNQGIKIGIISISQKQSSLAYNYILEFISRQSLFWDLLKTKGHTYSQLNKELSRERITIGSSTISVLTANINKRGENLLGYHFDLLIEDEAASIPDEIERTKIRRMMETSPADKFSKMHVKISTPHGRGHFMEWTNNPEVKTLKVPYEVGIQEGRVNKSFIELQRQEMTPMEFNVWYGCHFPEQESNKLFTLNEITALTNQTNFNSYAESPFKTLGVDVARYGNAKTVMTITVRTDGGYYSKMLGRDDKQSTTETVGKIIDLDRKYNFHYIIIDDTGIGGGVTDMLVEHGLRGKVIPFNAGGEVLSTNNKLTKRNAGSEAYIFFHELLRQGLTHYENNPFISKEMQEVSFEFTSNGKIVVAKKGTQYDPEISTADVIDSLVYSYVPFITIPNKGGYAFL